FLALTVVALVTGWLPSWAGWLVVLAALLAALAWPAFLLSLLVSGRWRRLARWRKRLAALLSVRHGLAPGGLQALLEDDDLYSTHLQRFLSEHQVPYAVSLYDE